MSKKRNKFILSGATAALVASAIVPVASAQYIEGESEIVKDDELIRTTSFEESEGTPELVIEKISPFKDVKGDLSEAVNYAKDRGIVFGYLDGTFKPNESIKRVHLALMIARALGATEDGNYLDAGFTDVPENYKWAVNFLAQEGIIHGIGDNKFGSNNTATRGQMAKILANAYNLESTGKTDEIPFTDVPEYYVPFVQAIYENGITVGTSETTYGSNLPVTRGQLATFIYRAEVPAEPEILELLVTDVNLLNAKEIEVVFNQDVSTETALNKSNYSLSIGTKEITDFKVELKDNKVLIKLNDEQKIKNGQVITLEVSENILSEEYNEGIGAAYEITTGFSDEKSPEIVEVLTEGNDLIVVFNEFVETADIIKLNGINVTIPAVLEESEKTIRLKGIVNSLVEGDNTLLLSGVNDISDNKSGVLLKTIVKAKDLTAPNILEVAQVDNTTFNVVFDKEVQFISGGTIKVFKNGFELSSSFTSSDNKEFKVNLADIAPLNVYGDREDTSNLKVVVEGYKSKSNNEVGSKVEKSIQLVKDTEGPVVDTTKNKVVNKATDGTTDEVFTIEFDENITLVGNASDIIVTNGEGVRQTVDNVRVITDTDGNTKTLEIEVDSVQTASGKIKAGSYSIQLPKKFVTDKYSNESKSNRISFTVDTKESEIAAVATGDVNKIKIAYDLEMGSSALEASNYSVDGKVLDSTSKIYFDTDKKNVIIELPENFIKVSGGAVLTINENVKTVTGKSLGKDKRVIYIATGLVDNTSPIIVSAIKHSNDTIELTFDENINDATLASNAADNDFIIKVNGTNFNYVASTGDVANDNKILLKTTDTFSFTSTITVEVTEKESDISITDLSTVPNTLVKGNVITVR